MKKFLLCLSVLLPALVLLLSTGAVGAVRASARGEDRITRILVLGVDRVAGLTDSIFVVTVNEDAEEARILQIPRDTYANYTDRDYKKLNGALSRLGERGVKDFLSDALGVRLDHFVVLDLSCLAAVVDAIGGVDVEIPQDMHYANAEQGLDLSLSSGRQHLDGRGAELLVRFRSGYPDADLGRLDAQKLFLSAFAKRCKALTLSEMLKVAWIALPRVRTDLGVQDIVRLANALRRCDAEHIPMATLSGEAVQGTSGAWYYSLCREGACRMVNEYLLPSRPLELSQFDRRGVFDRADNENFHKIYTAPDRPSGAG